LKIAKIVVCLAIWSGVVAGAVSFTFTMGWIALFLYGGAMVIVSLTAERETDAVSAPQNAGQLTIIQARASQGRTKAERDAARQETMGLRRLMLLPKLVGFAFAVVGLFCFFWNLDVPGRIEN
jgi:hypothetical protein